MKRPGMGWLKSKTLHDCQVPRGTVFDPIWACPDCGDRWELIERGQVSTWVRLDG